MCFAGQAGLGAGGAMMAAEPPFSEIPDAFANQPPLPPEHNPITQTLQPNLGNPNFSPTAPPLGGAGVAAGPAAPAAAGPPPLSMASGAAGLLPTMGRPGGALNKTTGAAKGAVTGAAEGAPLGPAGMAVGAVLGALPSIFKSKPKVPMQQFVDPSQDLMRSFGGV